MKEEYTRETYPSIGKRYNNEKAIISLTSWKARINTVSKTLFSLIKMCPGFHIVLCLSEEEFPLMEKELPKDLMLFVNNNLVEILWVYKNYKAFKKVLFTMDKYRDVPVISADDDCVYTCNYADLLYTAWYKEKNVLFYNSPGEGSGWGYIWPLFCYKENTLKYIDELYKQSNNDDLLYIKLCKKMNITRKCLNNKHIMYCHDTIAPINMGKIYKDNPNFKKIEHAFFEKVLKI